MHNRSKQCALQADARQLTSIAADAHAYICAAALHHASNTISFKKKKASNT
jgi:hypothetical protein